MSSEPEIGQTVKPWVMALFALVVVTSGFYRVLSADGGQTGLWFGIIMGGLALCSCWLLVTENRRPGYFVAWLCILVVGGWFAYESFVKKGIARAEPRQLIVIGVALFAALTLLSRNDPTRPENEIEVIKDRNNA